MDTGRALSPVLSRLIRDLHAFLLLLDQENLSYIAQAQKKSLWELLGLVQLAGTSGASPAADLVHTTAHSLLVPVEDAEYMIMSCPSSSMSDTLTAAPVTAEEQDWTGRRETQTGSEPADEDEEDTYEEAEPYVCHAITTSGCSEYESYGEDEEEEEQVKDRAHYIYWTDSRPGPPAGSRLCAYLWRRRWLQWSKEWFLIQRDMLLCYRCARDLLPQMELNLRGCRLVLKSKSNKKIQQQLKLTLAGPPVQILVLGFSNSQQAEEWRSVLQEVSSGADIGSGSSSRSDSEEDQHSHSSPDHLDLVGQDVLNVLMSCQWQSLQCRVEAGRLSMYAADVDEEADRAQYSIQLRGCRVTANSDPPYRITLSTLGDTLAVLEAASVEQQQQWVRRLQEGAGDQTGPTGDKNRHSGPDSNLPLYSNASQGSGLNRSSLRDHVTYSNAFLSGGGRAQVRRSVQKLELTRKTDVKRAGSEVNLSASKPTWFRQSLSVCTERAQVSLLNPLLRRTSSLRRTPSMFALDHTSLFQKRKVSRYPPSC